MRGFNHLARLVRRKEHRGPFATVIKLALISTRKILGYRAADWLVGSMRVRGA